MNAAASWHVSVTVWTGSAPQFLPIYGNLSIHCLPQLSMLVEKHLPLFNLNEAVKLCEKIRIQVSVSKKLTSI